MEPKITIEIKITPFESQEQFIGAMTSLYMGGQSFLLMDIPEGARFMSELLAAMDALAAASGFPGLIDSLHEQWARNFTGKENGLRDVILGAANRVEHLPPDDLDVPGTPGNG